MGANSNDWSHVAQAHVVCGGHEPTLQEARLSSQPKIGIENNSPEEVAFKLLRLIQEGMPQDKRSKNVILNIYAECLMTVRNPQNRTRARASDATDLPAGATRR